MAILRAVFPLNDVDGDGIDNSHDNCPNAANPQQLDANSNGIGDVCGQPTGPVVGAVVRLPVSRLIQIMTVLLMHVITAPPSVTLSSLMQIMTG